jgi:hypothetical protein
MENEIYERGINTKNRKTHNCHFPSLVPVRGRAAASYCIGGLGCDGPNLSKPSGTTF